MLYKVLKKNATICGRFIDSKINKPHVVLYKKIFERINELINEKISRSLSINQVTKHFKAYNFKIINTTEIDNITYFYAKKIE
jgi:hypothetical protein